MRRFVCVIASVVALCSLWFLGVMWSAQAIPQPSATSSEKPSPPVILPVEPRKRDVPATPPPPPLALPLEKQKLCFHTNTPIQVTDDRGYVCSAFDVLDSKCCNLAKPNVRRFVCDNCTSAGCCKSLEICTSCCMGQEDNRSVPERRRYQQCTSLCRTSHDSLNENQQYRKEELHHCFQRRPPKINRDPKEEINEIEWLSLQ